MRLLNFRPSIIKNLGVAKSHLRRSCLASNRCQRPAFTLIELLVATVVTGIMLTLVMASYWTFLKTNAKMQVSRELQSEVRFALTRVADKVRSSRINYPEYQGVGDCSSNINQQLCLLSPQGQTHFLYYDPALLTLNLGADPSATQPLLSPRRFTVHNLHISVSPADDPSLLTHRQGQPKVTLFIKASPTDPRYQDLVIETQTTISSRQY